MPPRAKDPPPVRHVADAERRARVGVRHALAPSARVEDAVEAARAVVALHATEPASVVLSAWARTPRLAPADVERVMWREAALVPQLAMRRTLFAMPRDVLPAMLGSICVRIADRLHRDLVKAAGLAGVEGEPAAWVERARRAVLRELEDGEPLSAQELRTRVPEAVASYHQGEGTKWAGVVHLGPRVLTLLGAQGCIMRCGNLGDWRQSRWLWTTPGRRFGAPVEPMDERAGYAEIVRRWLWANGPGTVEDIAWWLGATKAAVRAALADVEAVAVSLDGTDAVGWLRPDDIDPVAPPEPWVALLPVLDPTIMGWKDRGFALGPHAPELFDSVGNAGTTAWMDGRAVGVWVMDEAARVRVHPVERVAAARRRELDREASRLTELLDGVRAGSFAVSPAMRAAVG